MTSANVVMCPSHGASLRKQMNKQEVHEAVERIVDHLNTTEGLREHMIQSTGTILAPIIIELVGDAIALAATDHRDRITEEDFFRCHAKLFGEWSLLRLPLRTSLIAIRTVQGTVKGSDI